VSECPPFLNQFGSFGAGAGQLYQPAIAADPGSGHIFAAETGNSRVSEFDAEGNFINAWGWGVRDGAAELQICTTETGCMAGQMGEGPGQIGFSFGVAIDEEGNLWVLEFFSLRVQKFSPDGEFLLMIGGEVNKTQVKKREEQEANAEPVTVTEAEENLCTAASGDVCGAGTSGAGAGQFKSLGFKDPIELGPSGTIYVGDQDRIQKFDEDGSYKGEISLPGAGKTESLALSPDGRLYVISAAVTEPIDIGSEVVNSKVVREIGPSGEELDRLTGEWEERKTPREPVAVAVDAEGNVYVIGKVVYSVPVKEGEPPKFKEVEEVLAFDDEGSLISFEPDQAGFGASSDSTLLAYIATNVVGDGSGAPGEMLVSHFLNGTLSGKPWLSYIRSYGVPFDPKSEPPEIESQYTISVTADDATVGALINPHFTTDTTYQVEYGTGVCSAGGCEILAPIEQTQLGGGAVNAGVTTNPVVLEGLEPGMTYHYRFVAQNEAGGPIHGTEGTFTTFRPLSTVTSCPNGQFRIGAAAQLPDCRAYEMVSPLDKEGGEVLVLANVPGFPAGINQGALEGGALTYSSYRAFADPDSAPYTSQYIAQRDASAGWLTEPISPVRDGSLIANLDTQYRMFSENLASGWLISDSEPPLADGALPDQRNLYRRDIQSGIYEAECPAEVSETPIEQFVLEPQGSSADGSHLVFWANDRLTPDAVPGEVPQVYECIDGSELRLVSVLPGGEASPKGGSAGTAGGVLASGFGFRQNNVAGAVSEDGSRIIWTAGISTGPLYVRIGGSETTQITAANARFRAASSDGTRVIYMVDDNLFGASVDTEMAISYPIAGEVEGFMGASRDTQLVYFVSEEDLDDDGPGQAGGNNLYLYRAQADTYTFVAELADDDAREVPPTEEDAPVLTPVAQAPFNRSSRVTPDGLHAAFTSTATLTGYDNTDQASGKADAEVFLYDAAAEELLCVSCNPTNARPRGSNVSIEFNPFWVAAMIPGWENQLHASRVLEEDGERLFFEAIDPLALEDTNGVQDVYQWEAPGAGTCTESSSTYSSANGGCIDLISTGKSPQASEFVDTSSGGEDIFFKTSESLWSPDPGLLDIYDARMEGGFASPLPKPECEGRACQATPPPPAAKTAASLTFVGPGDVVQKPKPRCRKGTHKVRKAGKVRCVKNRKGKSRPGGRTAR